MSHRPTPHQLPCDVVVGADLPGYLKGPHYKAATSHSPYRKTYGNTHPHEAGSQYYIN